MGGARAGFDEYIFPDGVVALGEILGVAKGHVHSVAAVVHAYYPGNGVGGRGAI